MRAGSYEITSTKTLAESVDFQHDAGTQIGKAHGGTVSLDHVLGDAFENFSCENARFGFALLVPLGNYVMVVIGALVLHTVVTLSPETASQD